MKERRTEDTAPFYSKGTTKTNNNKNRTGEELEKGRETREENLKKVMREK